MTTRFRWLKGHGTENDFLLLPDIDGTTHGDLDPDLVRELCHRRRGIGADGVLRVVRSAALGEAGAEWFMDYRNADGSPAQTCGNGLRVFGRFLEHEGLVDPVSPVPIATRDGVKTVRWIGDKISVHTGVVRVVGDVLVGVGARSWPAVHVDAGNPHAVALVDSLEDPGPLRESPEYDPAYFPEGVNVEFAVRTGEASAAMRVFERGVGETRSCGTGACAVAAAVAGEHRPVTVGVTAPGGRLDVTLDAAGRAELCGPAVLVAEGTYPLDDEPRGTRPELR